ncbi:MAG: hypothetical protein ISF22_10830 [Methanomassiliicoccus sp.]|nr:hypothetical protein [Methanomassiliicoccus sp.]
MSFREVPSEQAANAEILASVQGLYPVPYGDVIRLLPKKKVMDLIEASRTGDGPEETTRLLATLEFNGEAVFRRSFSQMASRSVAVRATTLFRMMAEMGETREGRDDLMRRLLAPVVAEVHQKMAPAMDPEKAGLISQSLEDWTGRRVEEEIDAEDLGTSPGRTSPVLRVRMGRDAVPPDLQKYSRYFLKNLFRLNNIHGRNEFFHPPEVIDDYWEVVSPDQGVFHLEIDPSAGTMTVGLYHTSRSFGLARTENPDYYDLVEFLANEKRSPSINGCRVDVHGATPEDEVALEEAMSIETMVVEDPTAGGRTAAVPRPMSPEGLSEFRSRLMQLTGVRAEVRFPVNLADPGCGDQDFSVLGFGLDLDREIDRFIIDDVVVSQSTMPAVGLAFADKLLALSRQLYRDPPRFPGGDIDELDTEVRGLIDRAETGELTDQLAREIIAKITVLDYYESLARYSYALSEQLLEVLEGEQNITFTMPRVLLALLDTALEGRDMDDLIIDGLRGVP